MAFATVLPLLLVAAVLPAWLAQRKGHSFWLFYILGVILWLGALIGAMVAKDIRPRCPECAEPVNPAAARCPHCQSEIAGRIVRSPLPAP